MQTVLSDGLVGLAVLMMFSLSIFVHEFGHFLVARWRGLQIDEFAIWCGPKLFSFRRHGILYSWRIFPGPVGGFVKLPQMVTLDAVEGQSQAVPPAPPGAKTLVALDGPAMNVVLAFAIATIIYFVGLPVLVNPSLIGAVDPGSPEGRLGIREGDRVVMINGKAVRSWEDINTVTALAPTNVFEVVIERHGVRTTYRLAAQLNTTVGLKWLNLDPQVHPVIGLVEPGMPAEAAGLKKGDRFVSFGGVPVVSQNHLIDLVKRCEGKLSEVVIERESKRRTYEVTPRYDPHTKRLRMGVVFAGEVYELVRPGPAPWKQFASVWNRTIGVLLAVLNSRKTGVGASDLSGPLGILAMLAVVTKTDYRLALDFLVTLNVSLAVLNLLPLPVLDGGHIVLAAIERVRRRPLSGRLVGYISNAFAVLIVSFFLYVTFFDVRRLPLFKVMFQREAHVEQSAAPASATPLTNTPPAAPAPTPAR